MRWCVFRPTQTHAVCAEVLVTVGVLTAASSLGQLCGLRVVGREATGNQTFNTGRQIAVIIGIDRYDESTPLTNAAADAKAVRSALECRDYDVVGLRQRRRRVDLVARA